MHSITLDEALVLALLFFTPLLLPQVFIIAIVGKFRWFGWIILLLATFTGFVLASLTLPAVTGLFGFLNIGSLWLAVVAILGTAMPWALLPWKKFRSVD